MRNKPRFNKEKFKSYEEYRRSEEYQIYRLKMDSRREKQLNLQPSVVAVPEGKYIPAGINKNC